MQPPGLPLSHRCLPRAPPQSCVCLVSRVLSAPPGQLAVQHSLRPGHLLRVPGCGMSPSFPTSALRFVTLPSAFYTGLEWLCRKAQMGPSHSVSFRKLPGPRGLSVCTYPFQRQGFYYCLSIKMCPLFRMPVAAVIKYLRHPKSLVSFGFALLCFTARHGVAIKFRVVVP